MLIDGNGYLFYLLQTPDGLKNIQREVGGVYSAMETLIREHIALFRAAEIDIKAIELY